MGFIPIGVLKPSPSLTRDEWLTMDSSGQSGVIGEGDVQWMTAASGILHKEYHEKEFSKEGGELQMVQLWVNLPAQFKMSPPKYQSITKDQISIDLNWRLIAESLK